MSRKPIIINDVDVSGCGYIDHDSAWCELCMANCAEETNPCYYKRLKRKEQECEWWKRQAELGSDTTDRLVKQLEEKEQEIDYCRENLHKQLEQLKKKNEILEKDKANLDVIKETLKVQFKQLESENDSLKSELMQVYCYLDADKETIDRLKAELKDITIRKIDYLKESLLYKLTLQEIKEFVENEMEQNVDASIILQKCEVLKK